MRLPAELMRVDRRRLALYLIIFLAQNGNSVAVPILPALQDAFGVSIAVVALVTASWGAARLVLDLPLGLIVDRVSSMWLFVVGSLMIGVGALVSAMAPTFEILIAGRVIGGGGSAIVSIAAMMRLISLTDAGNRGRSLGIYQASLQAGSTVGPIFSGIAADLFGWPAAFLVSGVGAACAFLVVWRSGTLSDSPAHVRASRRRDTGQASETAPQKRGSPLWYYLFLVNLTTFTLFFMTGGMMQSTVPLLGADLGLSASVLGLMLGVATALRFVVSILGGLLADRYGAHTIMLVGFLVVLGALLIFPAIREPWLFIVVTWVMAVGRLGNSVPVMMLVERVSRQTQGRWIGTNRFIADLALVVSPLIAGLVIDDRGFAAAFYLCAALVGASILAMIVERRLAARA